jgi:hypothetical protein
VEGSIRGFLLSIGQKVSTGLVELDSLAVEGGDCGDIQDME